MKILQTENHTCSVENGSRFRENISVNVHHKISTGSILHHETYVTL